MIEPLYKLLLPEFILAGMACLLFLLGTSSRTFGRKAAPVLALFTLVAIFIIQLTGRSDGTEPAMVRDYSGAIHISELSRYIKVLTTLVGIMLLLLAWPGRADARGNTSLELGNDGGEFFGLMLLSLCGVFLAASANDIILLFLALELVSIPTYVMVSVSRPLAVSQEAGVKYFFLGAMSAALMLFGFSYLYGTTGSIHLDEIATKLRSAAGDYGNVVHLSPWQMLAVVMLIAGFCFKMAAVPLHFYAGDVYEGAATPVTAFLAFVPKTAGFIALIKVLHAIGGGGWAIDYTVFKLLWILACLTMTFGNVLALLQQNVKRVLAYSSVAHSGYMLLGLAALTGAQAKAVGMVHAIARTREVREEGLRGVLFYLAAYGIMNSAAFGVLMLLPARNSRAATSAETYDDIAGQGRRHLALGLAMAISCFSLIGIPLTVGFVGKLLLLRPALQGGNGMTALAIITLINAAISAAYYLKIIATMFLKTDPAAADAEASVPRYNLPAGSLPIVLSIALSVAATLFFGAVPRATSMLSDRSREAVQLENQAENLPAGPGTITAAAK